jgi:2-keto-3-deoxy-L-rhamnonate aldolase RhmA
VPEPRPRGALGGPGQDAGRNLKAKLAAGEVVLGCLCAYNAPWLIEVLALTGHDFVTLDLEHEPFNDESVADLIRTADALGLPTILRLPLSERVHPLLTAGARGIHVPDVKDRAHVEQVVNMTRFPPLGTRAYYTQTRATRYGLGIQESVEMARANEDLLVTCMIEDIELVKQLDSVLDIEGIDAFHVGPLDLAQSMGSPAPDELERVIADVVRRCREAKKYVAVGVITPWGLDRIERQVQQGIQIFNIASAWLLTHAIASFFNEVNGRIPEGRRSGPIAESVARNRYLSDQGQEVDDK